MMMGQTRTAVLNWPKEYSMLYDMWKAMKLKAIGWQGTGGALVCRLWECKLYIIIIYIINLFFFCLFLC